LPARVRDFVSANPQKTRAPYADHVAGRRKARVEDVHELALAMPHVTVYPGSTENPVYQVGGKSFVFFRTPRPDAVDPQTGERYADVIVFWVGSEDDKIALVQDETTPFFTTPHFDGHLSVLVRSSRIGELSREELAEVVQDAWLARPRSAARRTGSATTHRRTRTRTRADDVPTRADEVADSRGEGDVPTRG